jgi:hypothetical protein
MGQSDDFMSAGVIGLEFQAEVARMGEWGWGVEGWEEIFALQGKCSFH